MITILLFLLLSAISSSLSNFPVVKTSYGAVRGYQYQAANGFEAEIFKKIPFASPPIGKRRWKKAMPPEPWNNTHDATFFGPACAQVPSMWTGYVTGFSEDCLTLNIYSSKQCRETSCPVAFYIHGGGNFFGGVSLFSEETLVRNFPSQGVILVTVSYRVGPFGVMAMGDEKVLPANLAVHDVLESLRFIRSEIHAFGGDKEQITVLGHSSGATMALALVFSPAVNKPGEPPLFARAICMSTTLLLEAEEKQINVTHLVAKKLGCQGTAQEIIDCLTPLGTQEILDAAYAVGGTDAFSVTHLSGTTAAGELMPFANMKELRDQQKEHMEKFIGSVPTKLMIGTLLKEFGNKQLDRRAQPCDILGVLNYEECVEKYWSDVDTGKFEPWYETISQGIILTTSLYADAQAETGGEVFLYQMDYPAHSMHADDLYYIMGVQDFQKDTNEEWLSRIYPIYFTNFIKGVAPAPDWSPLNPAVMNYYSINKSFTGGISPGMKLGYHRELSEYYEGMMEYDAKLTNIKQTVLNTPVAMKLFPFDADEPFRARDALIYLTILCVILFIAYKLYQCYEDHRVRNRMMEERTPLVGR